MPFYAVGVGKIPGVYMTWEECKNQTKGFPKAKFRKFNNQAEAIEFVNANSQHKNIKKETASSTCSYSIENTNLPDLVELKKNFSNALLKQDRLSSISEKLDKFIEVANEKFSELGKRITELETLNFSRNSPERKRTNDSTNDVDRKVASKKKKISEKYEVDDFENDSDSILTRDESQLMSANDEEDVDGPWGGGFQGSDQTNPKFVHSTDGYVAVFTDGACSQNGRAGAKAGIGVWFNHNNPFNVSAPVIGSATNNNAEIQAATRAIEQANLAGITKLEIHTDSQFLINCITLWMKKWKKNNWMTTNGGPVKNKEQLVLLDQAIQSLQAVRWIHVRGHMGDVGNESADALARKGAVMY